MKRSIFISLFFLFIYSSVVIAQGPIQPTKDLIPKSKVKNTDTLNLPYKPKDGEDDPNSFLTDDMTLTDEDLIDDPNKVKIDWSQIPYLPSKYPDLPPAPDPEV